MGAEPLRFRRVTWSPRLAAALHKATAPADRAVNSEIVEGRAECWEIDGHGLIVTRLEVAPDGGRCFVVVAGVGRQGLEVLRRVPAICRANGATTWRIHSRRPGMARYLARAGLEYEQELGLGESVFHGRV